MRSPLKHGGFVRRNAKLYDWLRRKRVEKQMTLRQVAALIGRHHSIVGKIEQGQRTITIDEYLALCAVLDVDPHEGIRQAIAHQ